MADDSRRAADPRPGDPNEGVRIIGADEAAEAIERGDVAERRGGHLPRYGDRPARPPAGPKPALRFPLEPGDAEAPSLRPASGQRFDPRPAPAWDEPEPDDEDGDPWPSESTWGESGGGWDDDPSADVAAWTRGETGTQPAVTTEGSAAEPGLTWAEDFVGDEEPWDGSWDDPTGAVRWADDEAPTAAAASGNLPVVDPSAPGPDATNPSGPPLPPAVGDDDAWSAFSASDDAADGEADPIDPTEHVAVVGTSWSGDEEDADADGPADDAPWGEPSVGAPVAGADPDEQVAADAGAAFFDADGGWASEGGGTADADDEAVFDVVDEPSGQVALPHWTEPGTGQVPQVFADGAPDDGATSGSTPAIHWRGHDRAWEDDSFQDLADISDDVRVGAMDLDRPHDDEIYAFDEIDEMTAAAEGPEPVPGRVEKRVAPARPVPEAEAPHGGGAGRNIGVAGAVGLGLAGLAIVLLNLGPGFAMVLVIAALVVGIGEFQAAVQRAGYRPATFFGLAFTAFIPVAVFWKGIEAYPLLLVVTVMAAMAWHLVGADGDARVVESVGITLFGVAWVGGLGSFAALLLTSPNGTGVGMFVTAVIAAVGYDVGGLLIGRTMGTKPISDASPNKTLEGLLGGMFISLFATTVVVGMIGLGPWDSPGDAFKIGLLACLVAPLGDLCESLVKRDLGIKDMGNLLPEHGGVLDRFDTLLFVLPTVYYAAVAFNLLPS